MTNTHESTVAPLEEYTPAFAVSAEEYEPYIGPGQVVELQRLAEPLVGKGWANVSSTFVGGGVAEMLRSLVPLARSLGIDARWYVIRGHEGFFQVTKKLHNMLQGMQLSTSLEELFGAYLDTIDDNAKHTFIASDLVVIHDPQPAALVMNGVIFGNVLWRCHIDTSSPNPIVWRFLLPYINLCSGAAFTMEEFIGPGVQVPCYQLSPCIDPRAEKNRQYTHRQALDVLGPLFDVHNIDPGRPILAAVSRYDIHKNQATIIKAYQRLRERKAYARPPYLILLGNAATDDPEGSAVLAQLQQGARDIPDLRFWVNVPDNDRVVGALMRIARGLVHVSTREGFGLVVSEALWQGTPVIGSKVGGITKQVIDGQTGLLVEPTDVDAVAAAMARILENPAEAEQLGAMGREHVREHFLLPELLRRYLVLLRFYSGVDDEPPGFRVDDLAYSEVLNLVRPRHPHLALARSP